ncbi:hypothetical protein Ae505Ps2_3168 [Pseudonocardia sp. Ae505_Ps2]|nr:hypothetical protein Ae505Ps2_3168 [Pseudonocardia sp. Ae505_Ps2]
MDAGPGAPATWGHRSGTTAAGGTTRSAMSTRPERPLVATTGAVRAGGGSP